MFVNIFMTCLSLSLIGLIISFVRGKGFIVSFKESSEVRGAGGLGSRITYHVLKKSEYITIEIIFGGICNESKQRYP